MARDLLTRLLPVTSLDIRGAPATLKSVLGHRTLNFRVRAAVKLLFLPLRLGRIHVNVLHVWVALLIRLLRRAQRKRAPPELKVPLVPHRIVHGCRSREELFTAVIETWPMKGPRRGTFALLHQSHRELFAQ